MNIFDEIPAKSASWELAADITGVQVVSSDEAEDEEVGVDVLVPGYGECVVVRDALRPVEEGGMHVAEGGITGLGLDFMKLSGDGEPLYRLLELVGSPLTRLRLSLEVDADVFELDVARVLRSCPSLKTLTINGPEVNAAAFLNACREERTHLEEIACRFDDLATVCEELSDETTVLACNLKRMMYYFFDSQRSTNEWQARSFLPMLRANRVLEYVEVMAPRDLCHRYAPGMQRSHNAPLPVAREPFPLPSRLAFLSIFVASRRHCEREAKRAKHASPTVSPVLANFPVDRHVMAIIFNFAAERIHRRVYCNTWKVYGEE